MESIVGFRLSPRQRHLWTLVQKGGPRDARALLRLSGALNGDALRAAVHALAARHEALRTRFERLPGMPEALQAPGDARVAWEDAEDLSALSPAEREARIRALWAEEGGDALPAARLVRAADAEHLLLLRVHSVSADGASFGHLARDLAALYAAERGGAPVEDEPVPYLAVSEWLNEVGASEEAQAGRAFWARRCEGADLVLPVEREVAAGAEGEAGVAEAVTVRRALPADVAFAAEAFGEASGAGADAVLLAGWKALLHRLGAGASVRIGVAADGRADDELRHAVGPFGDHLPVATAVDAALPFRDLAERVREGVDEAAGWQEVWDRDGVRHLAGVECASLLRAGFTVVPAGQAHAGGGVEIEVDRVRVAEGPFALHLRVVRGGEGVTLELEGGATFPTGQLELLLDRYATLLADALARPGAPVGALAVMSAAERARVLAAVNPAKPRTADAEPVHALFEARAALTPDAPALGFGGETVAYGALNARANRRARQLRALGVGTEVRVGIMLPSSPARIEALLATLKAGGAYVPLDPAYPAERLAFMIQDAGLSLVLTSAALRGRVPAVAGVRVVEVDDPADDVAVHGDGDLELPIHPAQAAYVIYTSGSTGTPKGVAVPHGALAAHTAAVRAHYGLGTHDRVLQFASFNFDASVEQTLPPLAAGACVVLREEAISSVESLGRYVDGGITILNLPTAQWHLLAEEWARGEALPRLDGVRLVIAGGEAMLPFYVARWQETPAAGARLLNAYGPTEAVVTASAYDVPAGFPAGRRVPIGRPFGSRAAYVLDWTLAPVPVGVPGELFLGGEALARGYLGRPALTAERFVPDAFSAAPGGRLYRTGDLVRLEEDGALTFLGRADHQVKVRGFRIELGEVEAALGRHPNVAQAAVVVEERGEGEKHLAVYWVPREEPVADAAALRAFLLQHLPDPMVPGVFVVLETMPLTAAGKLDRVRLPSQRRIRADRPLIAPSGELETRVAAIWGEVMGQERVSMDDDFFASGGHSLLATQLTSRLRRHFAVDLQIGQVFEARTVADLARAVEALAAARPAEGPAQAEESIGRAPREGRRMSSADLAALLDG